MVTSSRSTLSQQADNSIPALSQVLQHLREETDAAALLDTCLGYIQQQVDYRLVWMLRYDRAGHCLQGQGGSGPNQSQPDFLRERVLLKSGDLLEQLMIQPRSLIDRKSVV